MKKTISLFLVCYFFSCFLYSSNLFNDAQKNFEEKKFTELLKLLSNDAVKSEKNLKYKKVFYFMRLVAQYNNKSYVSSFEEALNYMNKYPNSRESGDVIIMLKNSILNIDDLKKINLATMTDFKVPGLKKIIRKTLLSRLKKSNNIKAMNYFSSIFSFDSELKEIKSLNSQIKKLSENIKDKKFTSSEVLIKELKKRVPENGYFFRYFIFLQAIVQKGLKNDKLATALLKELITKYPNSKFTVPALNKLKNTLPFDKIILLFDSLEKKTKNNLVQLHKIAFIKGRVLIDNGKYEQAKTVFESVLKLSKSDLAQKIKLQSALLIVYKNLNDAKNLAALKKELEKYKDKFPFLEKILKIY
ncbi:hypothetical protein KAJ27_09270 [bacterium]|nr:hypothetical protein [bacterium]